MSVKKSRQEDGGKKPFRLKRIIAIFLPLFFILVFVFIVYTINQSYPVSSDLVISKVVGEMLQKDPNSLNRKDLLKITELDLSGQTIGDVRLLKKFKNLRVLDISNLEVSEPPDPAWKTFLIKFHIIKKPTPKVLVKGSKKVEMHLMSLQPLRNLSKLEILNLNYTPIESLSPLSGLKNLKELDIFGTPVSDLRPLSKLSNLKTLNLGQTKIKDLKPLKGLKNLRRIQIYNTKISDIEPLANLPNLLYFDIRNCNKLPYQQVENLQKSLPNLVVFDGRNK